MAAGNILLQANDSKVANIIFEDGASGNMSVTVPKEGGTLASEEFVGSAIADIPVVGDATSSVKGIDYKGLLYEAVVTGSAVTSIDFPLLDINTHKSYRVEIELINATASSSTIYCFINGDTVLTNYWSQLFYGTGTALGAIRTNAPHILSLSASKGCANTINIQKVVNKALVAINPYNVDYDSALYSGCGSVSKIATVANITQLTFTSSVASAIGVGSKIRIYRGDV